MNSLNKKLIIAFFFILMLGSFGLIVIDKAARSRIDNINFIGKVPSFSLTNFDGSIVTAVSYTHLTLPTRLMV